MTVRTPILSERYMSDVVVIRAILATALADGRRDILVVAVAIFELNPGTIASVDHTERQRKCRVQLKAMQVEAWFDRVNIFEADTSCELRVG